MQSKRCGYIAYEVDYTLKQSGDPGSMLNEGDVVDGYIVTKKVTPYIANNDLLTTCTVPVFCSKDDLIQFEIELERAVERAGKTLASGQLDFGEVAQLPQIVKRVPDDCLVVMELEV